MGAFAKAIIRQGFSTVYRPSSSITPASRDQLTKNSPAEISLSSGTGTNAVDLEYIEQITLAASVNNDYDLRGVLVDAFGGTLSFAKVKGLYLFAAVGNTNNVIIKPAASNGFLGPFGAAAHQISVPPGGSLQLTAPRSGWTVTAGTGDLINIANSSSGSSVTFDLHIIGTSA